MNSILSLTRKHRSHGTLWFGLLGAIAVIVCSLLLGYTQTQKVENQKEPYESGSQRCRVAKEIN